MSVDSGPTIKLDALKVCLDAANRKSYVGTGNLWSDLSFNGNNATLNASPSFSNEKNGVFLFTGATDSASITAYNDLDHGSGEFTYSIWLSFSSLATSAAPATLFENGSYAASGTSGSLLIRHESGTPNYLMRVYHLGGAQKISATFQPDIDSWYNLIFTKQQNVLYFYSNGAIVSQAADTTNFIPKAYEVRIGQSVHSATQNFNGKIASVSIYKTGMSSVEVFDHFSAHRHRFGI